MCRKIFLPVACLVVGLAAFCFFWREHEPSYAGKSLSQWVAVFGGSPPNPFTNEARIAVRAIGTNAIPYLLKWIQYDPAPTPRWKSITYTKLNEWFGYEADAEYSPEDIRAEGSTVALAALGPQAEGAIPDLCRIMNDPRKEASAFRVVYVLANLGPEGMPPLMVILTNNANRSLRYFTVTCIEHQGTNAGPAIPLLVAFLKGSDLILVHRAAVALGNLKIDPNVTVPILMAELENPNPNVRVAMARGLGKFGTNALMAVPALFKALDDPKLSVRTYATNALQAIAPEALRNATYR